MRKLLIVGVLAGSALLGFGRGAEAAPVAGVALGMLPAPVASTLAVGSPDDAVFETVQYRCGPRCRAERRREWRRRHNRRY